MNEELLDKATQEYCKKEFGYFSHSRAFQDAVEWVMSLPLSERLTDKERQKIRIMYRESDMLSDTSPIDGVNMSGAIHYGKKLALTELFGEKGILDV